jgi:hypothetical protein
MDSWQHMDSWQQGGAKKAAPGKVWATYHYEDNIEEMEVKEDIPFKWADTLLQEVKKSKAAASKSGSLDLDKYANHMWKNYLGHEGKVNIGELKKEVAKEIPVITIEDNPDMTQALADKRQEALSAALSGL